MDLCFTGIGPQWCFLFGVLIQSRISTTTTTTIIEWPFVRDYLDEPYQTDIHPLMWRCPWSIMYHLLGLMVQQEDNRGRSTDNPAGRHAIQTIGAPTSIIPTIFLHQMHFRLQPSQFFLACDMHHCTQVCWVAYLVAWLISISINCRETVL